MSVQKKNVIDKEDLDFIIRIVRKNWLITLIILIISFGLSKIFYYKQVEVYAARTQLLLTSEETSAQDKLTKGLGYFWWQGKPGSDYSNKLKVVKSYDLILKAVEKLNLDVSYYISGRFKTREVYDGVPFNVKLNLINPSLYNVPINFKIIDEKFFQLNYTLETINYEKKFKFNETITDPNFKITVLNPGGINPLSLNRWRNINYIIVFHNISSLVSKFQSSLSAEIPEGTAIMQLTVNDQVEKRAITFLDTLTKLYVEKTLATEFEINKNTLDYIDKQLAEITVVLNSIEDDLENYKETKSILNLGEEEQKYFSELTHYESENNSLRLRYATLESLEKYIIENKDPVLMPPSFYFSSDDPFLTNNMNALYEMQMTRLNTLFNSTEQNISIKEFDKRFEKLKENLLLYISNNKKAILVKIEQNNGQINNFTQSIKTIPEKQRELLNIQRKLQVNEKMYLFLLEKKSTTIISKAGIISTTTVLEVPRGIGKVQPDGKKITSQFLTIGAAISLIIVLIRFFFFDRIEDYDQLRSKTNKPILGEIVYSEQAKQNYIVVDIDPKSIITESFRSMRTNLEYLIHNKGESNKGKIILFTSNNPGEGKTFCSLNFAVILARAGKKVLLLELDLHKPKIQKGLKMASDTGLSMLLSGMVKAEDAILPTEVVNLDVILSGPAPPNASELILSSKMDDLMEYSRERYDFVVIDSPPVALITDAIVLMKHADTSIFVVNTNNPNKNSIDNAHEIADMNNIKNLAFLLNGVKRKTGRYYNKRYSYGYGYGYGYSSYGYGYGGEKEAKKKNWLVKLFFGK